MAGGGNGERKLKILFNSSFVHIIYGAIHKVLTLHYQIDVMALINIMVSEFSKINNCNGLIKVMAEFFSIRSYSLVVIVKLEGSFAVFTVSNAVISFLYLFSNLKYFNNIVDIFEIPKN